MSQIAPKRKPIAIARIIRLQMRSVNLNADRKNSIICTNTLLSSYGYTEDIEKIYKSKLFKPLTSNEMVVVENHLNTHFTFSILRLVVNNDIAFLLLNS